MVVMPLLIDENVPESVTDFLRERGHRVDHVRDLYLAATPDPIIAAVADRMGAIVVTWNHRDFKKLAARVPREARRHCVASGESIFDAPSLRAGSGPNKSLRSSRRNTSGRKSGATSDCSLRSLQQAFGSLPRPGAEPDERPGPLAGSWWLV